jgi:predicted nucleic acid-binding protein
VIVVDASLAVKLYRDEAGSNEALAFIAENAGSVVVPDLFLIEVAGAIVRDANIAKGRASDRTVMLENFSRLMGSGQIRSVRTQSADLNRAAGLAIALGHPLKDCIYLTLAMELGCDLLTCDARFAEKAKAVWAGVRVLGT